MAIIITALIITVKLGILGKILILPALPISEFLQQYFQSKKGETELKAWDYFVITVVVAVSSLFWGFIAGLLSKYVFVRKNKSE